MPVKKIVDVMKEKQNRPYHHGDLRNAILDTAMEMMLEEDGWNFTLREVARRAGVSHSAPYKHFPDKMSLLGELALIGFDRAYERIRAAMEEPATFRAKFLRVAKVYLQFAHDHPALYRLMLGSGVVTEQTQGDPRAAATFELAVEMIEQGQREGAVRPHPVRGQAAACWAQLHGLTMLDLEGFLIPEKVGEKPVEAALNTLLEGLEE